MISKKIGIAILFIFAIPLLLFSYSFTVDYKSKYPVVDMNDTDIDDNLGDFFPNILYEDKLDLKVIECDGFIICYSERFKTPVLAIYRHSPDRNNYLGYFDDDYGGSGREEGYLVPVEAMKFSPESLEDARSKYNKIPGKIANNTLYEFEHSITSLVSSYAIRGDLHYRDNNGNIVKRKQNEAVIITGLEIEPNGDDIRITNNVWKMVLYEINTGITDVILEGAIFADCMLIKQNYDELPLKEIAREACSYKENKGIFFGIIRPSYYTYRLLELDKKNSWYQIFDKYVLGSSYQW